jgi:hypothetical protein
MTHRMHLVCVVLLGIVAVSGCTSGGSPAADGSGTPQASSTPATPSAREIARERALAQRRAQAAAHRRAEASAKACAGKNMHLRLAAVGAGAGSYYRIFSLRNDSSRPCVVDTLGIAYADSALGPVGYPSRSPGRLRDGSGSRTASRRALLAGERTFLSAGTVNPAVLADGCGEAHASNEVLTVNNARFVLPLPDGVVCATSRTRPWVTWDAPRPHPRNPPSGFAQPYLA